ncbi:MAG: cob(I)yrinic acid a,c-diamide adenosyltransferase [Thermodesulforhabdaceae bacterium]
MEKNRRGLLIIFTGEGKGKTSAALGMVLRAAGHGMKVGIFQFIKGKWHPGELTALSYLPNVEVVRFGGGFTRNKEDLSGDSLMAREGWEKATKAILENLYDMIILDEINYAIHRGFIGEQEVLDVVFKRPEEMHIVLTGRYAPESLVDAADMVTEMKVIKHHFRDKGIRAQKGIEF